MRDVEVGNEGTTDKKSVNRSDNFDNDDDGLALPIVFLYRGIFIQALLVIPMGLYWISGVKPLLLFLGQNAELAIMTEVSGVTRLSPRSSTPYRHHDMTHTSLNTSPPRHLLTHPIFNMSPSPPSTLYYRNISAY